jgi:DNA-binding NarL/FixJ family response regulator
VRFGTVRVLLVDDHELFLHAAVAALESERDEDEDMRFEVAGTATHGRGLVSLVDRLRPDVVVLDIVMPGLDGLVCLQLLRQRFPQVRVVMLSGIDDPSAVHTALAHGASAYIVKTIAGRDLASALRQVVTGALCVPAPSPRETAPLHRHALSGRELEILAYIARGVPNAAIAKELCVTEQTVKFHLTNVYRKLGVKNRTEAARVAMRLDHAVHPLGDPRLSA